MGVSVVLWRWENRLTTRPTCAGPITITDLAATTSATIAMTTATNSPNTIQNVFICPPRWALRRAPSMTASKKRSLSYLYPMGDPDKQQSGGARGTYGVLALSTA